MTRLCLLALTAILSLASATTWAAGRNVILIIGDGMDDHQISIARNYMKGAEGRLTLDSMPMRGVAQVLTVDEQGKRVYVADSANSATSMATGKVTSRGRISTAAGSDAPLGTITELAETLGFRTGLVTTASVTDATPAAFVAHINVRYCESPQTMEGNEVYGITLPDCPQHTKAGGGLGSISEQIAESDLDLVMGGGLKHFTVQAENDERTVMQLARDRGFHVVTNRDEFMAAPADAPLLGLFSESTMPVRMRGQDGREAEKPEPSWLNRMHYFLGSVSMPEPMTCEPNPDFVGMPTLKQMTEAALQRLKNESGFFLMVESASIDKQSHERKPCGSIGELDQLEETLKAALAFAQENPETLILVTADHGQAAQMVPEYSLFSAFGAPVFTRGHLARIITPEGGIMGVNYATNDFIMEAYRGQCARLRQ
jgi:alkaline phosphatase